MPDNEIEKDKLEFEKMQKTAQILKQKFHLLEEALDRIEKDKEPPQRIYVSISKINNELIEFEKHLTRFPMGRPNFEEIKKSIENLYQEIETYQKEKSLTLDTAHTLMAEIKELVATITEASASSKTSGSKLRIAKNLPELVEAREYGFMNIKRTGDEDFFSNIFLNQPFDLKVEGEEIEYVEKAGINKLRLHARSEKDSSPVGNIKLVVYGVTPEGEKQMIAGGNTNNRGYSSIDLSHVDQEKYQKIEIKGWDGKHTFHEIDLEHYFDFPVFVPIPDDDDGEVKERPHDITSIDFPDAEDLENDPDSFSFESESRNGTRCIKSRPDISVRNFNFSQLVRTQESQLVEQDAENAARRNREAVTAPVPMREKDNPGANLSVVGADIISGKIINYRQYWQPVAQGLGKLLYSLALAPREEMKIAMIDWRRTETARYREGTRFGESLSADLKRDTTVSDIVTGNIEEQTWGGSKAEASTEASNKPGWLSYLAGGVAGLALGGPAGAALGVAAVHYIRPDTGADSSADIKAWNNAVRNISAQAVHKASDTIRQRASAVRDLRSTVITSSTVTEQEHVRTRTIRNQNQHHAMTIQYYQVLAHYRVKTEAVSEQDVLMVPYAIDHDIFGYLPHFNKFIIDPLNFAITRFCLKYPEAIRLVLPQNLKGGVDALHRLVYDKDEYEDPQITASRWVVSCKKGMDDSVSLALKTPYGLIPLRARDRNRTLFSSPQVALDQVEGIQLNLDINRVISKLSQSSSSNRLMDYIFGRNEEQAFERDIGPIHLTAHLDPSRYLRSSRRTYIFNETEEGTFDINNFVLSLDIDQANLQDIMNKRATPQGADYEAVEKMVIWMQQNPMVVMEAIWLTEDSHERALRFDRLRYGNKALLNIIENQPLGVDGNYVAFRLAPNLRFSPPIDMSKVPKINSVISVPTDGVFAETYLSCNIATEKRDMTRQIDESKAMPFAAPDIEPISTAVRSGADIPEPTALPSSIINLQNVPDLPGTSMGNILEALKTPSPFHDLSFGGETMKAVQTLAEKALEADAEKQKKILETITELSKLASQVALASMGVKPPGSGKDDGGSNSSGKDSSAGSSKTPEAKMAATLRETNPDLIRNHYLVIQEIVEEGFISLEEGTGVIKALLGLFNGAVSDEVEEEVEESEDATDENAEE